MSLWGPIFPHTRRCHWCVENFYLKCLQRNMSVLYTGVFFLNFFYILIFSDKILFFCMFVQYIGCFWHFFLKLLSWERWGDIYRNRFRSLKWKHECFSTSNIFFTLLPGQDCLGQKVMQQKNTWKLLKPMAYAYNWHKGLFKTGMTFYPAFWTQTQPWQQQKKVSQFSGQLLKFFLDKTLFFGWCMDLFP